MTENDLKIEIRQNLDGHFIISEECEGVYNFEGEKRNVKADFIIEPSDEIITNYNLPKGKYVIETKYLNDFTIPKLSDLFIQCLTYKNTRFNNEFPLAVFIYTNQTYTFHPETRDSRMLEVLFCTFGKINIGRLELMNNGFSFLFHKGDTFFRYKNGEYKAARKDLLNISFGSGNNKLYKKY